MEKVLKVSGMMCSHCEARVQEALEAIDGVVSAVASHEKGLVTVTLGKNVPSGTLGKAVAQAGYIFEGVRA